MDFYAFMRCTPGWPGSSASLSILIPGQRRVATTIRDLLLEDTAPDARSAGAYFDHRAGLLQARSGQNAHMDSTALFHWITDGSTSPAALPSSSRPSNSTRRVNTFAPPSFTPTAIGSSSAVVGGLRYSSLPSPRTTSRTALVGRYPSGTANLR